MFLSDCEDRFHSRDTYILNRCKAESDTGRRGGCNDSEVMIAFIYIGWEDADSNLLAVPYVFAIFSVSSISLVKRDAINSTG